MVAASSFAAMARNHCAGAMTGAAHNTNTMNKLRFTFAANCHASSMEPPIACPYCFDMDIEVVPNAKLHLENFPRQNQTKPLAGSVFRCSYWHIFATFPLESDPQPLRHK